MKFIKTNRYLAYSVLLFSFIPILGTQLYIYNEDVQSLLWASEFDKPLIYVFSPDPEVNNLSDYSHLGGYYRPFMYLYVMFLQNTFGNSPFYFHVVGGLLLIGSVVFLFKITELLSSNKAAFLSVILYIACFYSIMSSLFRIVYPFMFFFQMGCFYFCLLGLVRNKYRYLILSLLFLLPASSRQTTPIILAGIISSYFLSNWRTVFPNNITKFSILGFALMPAVTIPLSIHSSNSSSMVVGESFNLPDIINLLSERLYFYGGLLTTGVTGTVLFSIAFLYIFIFITSKMIALNSGTTRFMLLIIPVSILTYASTHAGYVSIFILLALLGACFAVNKSVRYTLTWFVVSLCLFLNVSYYHGSYLLEAAHGLSVSMGILLYLIIKEIDMIYDFNKLLKENRKRIVIAFVFIVVICSFIFIKTGKAAYLSEKLKTVQVLVNHNRNFRDIMAYIEKDIPQNSVVYEYSDIYLGQSKLQRRFFSLRERAEYVKIMRINDKRAWMKLLGRPDISFRDATEIDERDFGSGRYFLAGSRLEITVAQKMFSLKLVKKVRRKETEAAVYLLE